MSELKVNGIIFRKAGNGKGFLIEGNETWFNAGDKVIPYLAKLNVGDEVTITYFKKGIKQEVTMIKPIEQQQEEPEEPTAEFTCEDCGKALKDGKFKKCFMCNKKAPKTKVYDNPTEEKPDWTSKSKYGSAEDVAGKEVGCAAGCAANILSGRQEDPETLLELWRILFDGILDHIRANK